MRPFQLSAVLVSAGVLLSGCFFTRQSVDLDAITHARSEEEVCHVSRLAMAGEGILSLLLFRVTLANVGRSGSDEAFVVGHQSSIALFPGAFSLFFAADSLMGLGAEQDCAEAQAVWRMLKREETQRQHALTPPQPADAAPHPSAPEEAQPTPAPDPAEQNPPATLAP